MNLKIKKLHPDAKIPAMATDGAAGFDLTAVSKEWDEVNQVLVLGTGLAIQIPRGHVGLLFPRSSIYKTELSLANSVGVIDSDYRGEVKAMFYTGRAKQNYNVGDRVVQLVIVQIPAVNIQVVDELNDTKRSSGGFGSTGA
tara:strand:- start:3150 stop:3572 length:423 start_codon:yes stop_codon:yes gene_type:complete